MFKNTSAFSGEYEHYYSKDPAFDSDAEAFNYDKWLETKDEAHLPRRNGASPIRFTLRRLSSREWLYLRDIANRVGEESSAWVAAALAVRSISPYVNDKNEDVDLKYVTENGFRRLSDEDMNRIALVDRGDLMSELVNRVIKESRTDPL